MYFDIIKTKRGFSHGQYGITIILLLILVSQATEDAKQFIFFESEVENLKDESFETKEIALLSNDESEEEFNDFIQKALNDENNKISKIDENYSIFVKLLVFLKKIGNNRRIRTNFLNSIIYQIFVLCLSYLRIQSDESLAKAELNKKFWLKI